MAFTLVDNPGAKAAKERYLALPVEEQGGDNLLALLEYTENLLAAATAKPAIKMSTPKISDSGYVGMSFGGQYRGAFPEEWECLFGTLDILPTDSANVVALKTACVAAKPIAEKAKPAMQAAYKAKMKARADEKKATAQADAKALAELEALTAPAK